MSKDTGGPAFPANEMNGDGSLYMQHFGMTLRDYFAAKAMQAQIASYKHGDRWPFDVDPSGSVSEEDSGSDQCAIVAYWFADSMLKARTK